VRGPRCSIADDTPMLEAMTQILLVGTELPLLEGLAQSFAAQGFTPVVAQSLHEARESAAHTMPLIVVVSRALAAVASAETLGIPLAPGGALVLYRSAATPLVTLPPSVQRAVLADLSLPLERNRLMALVHHVGDRVRTTGRGHLDLPSDEAPRRP
jgi:DNA-binding NtrC family response regulator